MSLEIDIDSVFCEGGEDVGRQDQFGDIIICVSEVLMSPRRLDLVFIFHGNRVEMEDLCIEVVGHCEE